MGSIYLRGDTYWIKYYRNGKPYRESSRSNKISDAKRLLQRREGEISEGKLPGIYFDRVRFDELADDYFTDYRINGKKTLAKAQRIVRLYLAPFFGGRRVSEITTALVKKYIATRLDSGSSNATINRELAALKRMFHLASQSTPAKISMVPYIPMLAEHNVRKGFFEHDEFLKLRDALPDYLRGVVTFAYKTGWRLGEIIGLTWDRVDLTQGVVRLEAGETKNREGRTVYLDDELKGILRAYLISRRLDCPYVFHRHGQQIKNIRSAWALACKRAGLRGKLFHDLRRTAVRNMVRAGVPERVAMMISGHKTRSVFDRYNIVSPEDLKAAAAKVEEFLSRAGGETGTSSGTILVLDKAKGASRDG